MEVQSDRHREWSASPDDLANIEKVQLATVAFGRRVDAHLGAVAAGVGIFDDTGELAKAFLATVGSAAPAPPARANWYRNLRRLIVMDVQEMGSRYTCEGRRVNLAARH